MTSRQFVACLAAVASASSWTLRAQDKIIHVPLAYSAPGDGKAQPNFSPKGTQVALADADDSMKLPAGATRPAKIGKMRIGPDEAAWIPVLATADADHPKDLCRLFVDRNRNGNFADDPAIAPVAPAQNEKTRAWWSSFNKVELSVPYAKLKTTEPYLVNFWIVREDDQPAPNVVRYSVGSWRYGTATVNGVEALVAAMDSNNDALFDKTDTWSVLEASAPNAAKTVLSINEARGTNRMMFVADGAKTIVLEFRSFSPDGRSVDFAVVDRPVTKAEDRAGDDITATERSRPRATVPFNWGHDLPAAIASAKTNNRRVLIDFETSWCGPCHTMDQWIWTDAEVAGVLNAGYIGVKLDGDIEKAFVKQYKVAGYPTMVILDANGAVTKSVTGYQGSAEILKVLK